MPQRTGLDDFTSVSFIVWPGKKKTVKSLSPFEPSPLRDLLSSESVPTVTWRKI